VTRSGRTCVRGPATAAALLAAALPAAAGTLRTPRGDAVPWIVDVPPGAARAPALVIAPGQAYPAAAPLLAALAEAATDAGIVAVRFDWAYTAADGGPSPGLANEREDLETVLRATRADPRVDTDRLFLAGKSLGSIVAYRVFRDDPVLLGFLLLTPVGVGGPDPSQGALGTNYPDLAGSRPVVVTVGDDDPLCPPPRLLAHLAETGAENVFPLVVPGDHGLRIRGAGDAANAANVETAARMNVQWVRARIARRSSPAH